MDFQDRRLLGILVPLVRSWVTKGKWLKVSVTQVLLCKLGEQQFPAQKSAWPHPASPCSHTLLVQWLLKLSSGKVSDPPADFCPQNHRGSGSTVATAPFKPLYGLPLQGHALHFLISYGEREKSPWYLGIGLELTMGSWALSSA